MPLSWFKEVNLNDTVISFTITNDLADKLKEEYFSYLTSFTFLCIYQPPRVFLMSAFFLLKYQDLQYVAKLST